MVAAGGISKNSSAHNGSYFQGCNSPKPDDDRAGGGGGYFGGSCSYGSRGGAGGGSSYISGYKGSIAIESLSSTNVRFDSNNNRCTTEKAKDDITCSIHYSNKIFYKPVMISGSKEMVPRSNPLDKNDKNTLSRIAIKDKEDLEKWKSRLKTLKDIQDKTNENNFMLK